MRRGRAQWRWKALIPATGNWRCVVGDPWRSNDEEKLLWLRVVYWRSSTQGVVSVGYHWLVLVIDESYYLDVYPTTVTAK